MTAAADRSAAAAPAAGSPADLVTPAGLARHAFRAMGTEVTVLLPAARRREASLVEELFAHWEAVLTRFRPDSELSRLNASAGRRVPVGALLFEVIETAVRAARATDGLFDPTVLPHLVAAGYDRTFEEIARDDPGLARDPWGGAVAGGGGAAADRGNGGLDVPDASVSPDAPILPGAPVLPPTGAWRGIELDRAGRSIRLPEGAAIDLGGIAKGMAVDAALEGLVRADATPAAVDAGGDLAVAGLPPGLDGWPIGIELPHGSRTIAIRGGALATSGISRRQWRRHGELRHHLIDPRTGMPAATGTWSATVAAPTGAQAEVAAKALFLLGAREGAVFMLRHGLTGLLVEAGGAQVALGGWDRETAA